ncbi:formyltransferase family protein, partial [Legionella shakespearei]
MFSFKIALFAGNDLSTMVWLNHFMKLKPEHWQINIYSTGTPVTKRCALLRQYHYFERDILPELHARFDKRPLVEDAMCVSPYHLSRLHHVSWKVVNNLNTPSFLDEIKSEEFHGALSVRFLKIFKPDFIGLFQDKFLWNLHAGALPQFRGVMPLFRTMNQGLPQTTLTLHQIDKGIDTGSVVTSMSFSRDNSLSLLESTCVNAIKGAEMVLDTLEKRVQGTLELNPQPVSIGTYPYNTYPTHEEIVGFKNSGLKMLPQSPLAFILKQYGFSKTELGLGDTKYSLFDTRRRCSLEFESLFPQ